MVQGIIWLMARQFTVGSQEGVKNWRSWKEISSGGDQWVNLSDCWEMWHLHEGKQQFARCFLLRIAWPIRAGNSRLRALLAALLQRKKNTLDALEKKKVLGRKFSFTEVRRQICCRRHFLLHKMPPEISSRFFKIQMRLLFFSQSHYQKKHILLCLKQW